MKGQRTSMMGNACAVARALDAIGDWWSMLIVREAFYGRRRFGEFQKSLGLAKNILAVRLRKLVDCGVLAAVPSAERKNLKEYVLTPKGESLHVVMVALYQWGAAHCFKPGERPITLVDSALGAPLQAIELKAQDGRAVGLHDLRFVMEAEQ